MAQINQEVIPEPEFEILPASELDTEELYTHREINLVLAKRYAAASENGTAMTAYQMAEAHFRLALWDSHDDVSTLAVFLDKADAYEPAGWFGAVYSNLLEARSIANRLPEIPEGLILKEEVRQRLEEAAKKVAELSKDWVLRPEVNHFADGEETIETWH